MCKKINYCLNQYNDMYIMYKLLVVILFDIGSLALAYHSIIEM